MIAAVSSAIATVQLAPLSRKGTPAVPLGGQAAQIKEFGFCASRDGFHSEQTYPSKMTTKVVSVTVPAKIEPICHMIMDSSLRISVKAV